MTSSKLREALPIESLDAQRFEFAKTVIAASARGDLVALRSLHDTTALCQIRLPSGQTPLHAAAEFGHLDVVRFLLMVDCRVDAIAEPLHETPLHLACWAGHLDSARELLEAGADVDLPSRFGEVRSPRGFAPAALQAKSVLLN